MAVCRMVFVYSYRAWIAYFVMSVMMLLVWTSKYRPSTEIEVRDTAEVVNTSDRMNSSLHMSTNAHTIDKFDKDKWTLRRKEMLSQNKRRKVILSAYMRGGSSIAGQIFNKDETAVYWYEPLGQFYMNYFGQIYSSAPWRVQYETGLESRIILTDKEQQALVEYFDALLSCDYDRLPPIAWMHPFVWFSKSEALSSLKSCVLSEGRKSMLFACPQLTWLCDNMVGMSQAKDLHCFELITETQNLLNSELYDNTTAVSDQLKLFITARSSIPGHMLNYTTDFAEHVMCMKDKKAKYQHCLEFSQMKCKQAGIHSAKLTRLNLEYVEFILQAIPDLHVVHFVRDPRGVAASRVNSNGLMIHFKTRDIMTEVEFLCSKMREDLKRRHEIEARFPGALLQIRYEDFVLEPQRVSTVIYQFIGKTVSGSWLDYADIAFHGDSDEKYIKKNATQSILKWTTYFSDEQVHVINGFCSDVLVELGYPMVVHT